MARMGDWERQGVLGFVWEEKGGRNGKLRWKSQQRWRFVEEG